MYIRTGTAILRLLLALVFGGRRRIVRIPEEYHEADNLTVMSLLVSSGLTLQC